MRYNKINNITTNAPKKTLLSDNNFENLTFNLLTVQILKIYDLQ